MRPTVETRRSSGSSVEDLEADRAGLGHAVGDRDLAQVHLRDRALHDLDRARAAGHDAGAQDDRSNCAKSGWSISAMNIVGTPWSAVQRSASTVFKRRERIEAFARKHHRGAVRHAGEVAQHHAEAMVERHRDAQPVVLGRASSPRR